MMDETAPATDADAAPPPRATPLRHPVFRAVWLATIVSNTGTWMHDVGAGWLMTSLTADPLVVALVQSGTTLPIFLFGLPAGTLADIVDRRRLMIAAQLWALTVAALLAAFTFAGATGPALLVALTFALGIGAAATAPAFQAIVPELVPKADLPQAVTLNSLGVNISRAVGPAIGGLIVALAGPAAVFALNAVSIAGLIIVLARWRRTLVAIVLPPEQFGAALRAGLRYARQSVAIRAVLVRSVAFFLSASGLWALLPIVGRRELNLGAAAYGGLLACLGLGAVLGALLLPRLRARVAPNRLTVVATLMFAAAAAGLSLSRGIVPAGLTLVGAGAGWIWMISALNGAAQAAAPTWVKARAMAVYLVIFQGAMSAGALLWGWLASQTSVPVALGAAATGLVLGLATARTHRLTGAILDLAPSHHWPAPVVETAPEPDRGPVLVTVEYHIDPTRLAAFTAAMRVLKRMRLRDGAIRWGLYQDAAAPGVVLETFLVESWLDHLRQHERVSNADMPDQGAVRGFHIGDEPPRVRHLIAPPWPRA